MDCDERTALTVVLVSGGYPGDYKKGTPVYNTEKVDGSLLFHSGTDVKNDQVVTNGGRVFAVTSFGADIISARNQSLKNAAAVTYEGKYYRKDIGFDLI
jgi:phosphoribosylamine--glycine ligase